MNLADTPIACAHCDSRTMVDEAGAEHMCAGFVFDWLEGTSGLRQSYDLPQLVAFMNANGI